MKDDNITFRKINEIDDEELSDELRAKLEARHAQMAKASLRVENCMHMGVEGTPVGMWCPQCWRIFVDGIVLPFDQREEGEWVVIMPPFIFEDLGFIRDDV